MDSNSKEALAKLSEIRSKKIAQQKADGTYVPPERNPIVRNIIKPTRGNAIKAFCAQCMGCNENHVEPGWREEVKNCTATKCALYTFRPGAAK